MKKLISILIICSIFSCEKEDTSEKWKLIKMSSQMVNSEQTGTDMEWQEMYLLNPDGSFSKSRDNKGKLLTGSGTYILEDLPDGKYLILTYKIDNPIIGNCTANLEEQLLFNDNGNLINTWSACDGPLLEYENIK